MHLVHVSMACEEWERCVLQRLCQAMLLLFACDYSLHLVHVSMACEDWKRCAVATPLAMLFAFACDHSLHSLLLQLWRQHWDFQLYKALEYQYLLGLEVINKTLPDVEVRESYGVDVRYQACVHNLAAGVTLDTGFGIG